MIGKIAILGGSHARIFHHNSFSKFYPNTEINICSVDGATITGLKNPNSQTQAGEVFTSFIESDISELPIVLIGEVDIGFLIWYRNQFKGEELNELKDRFVTNYLSFIRQVRAKYGVVIALSIPLPTIQDGEKFGDVANARKNINASQMERTNFTIKVNNELESLLCKLNGVHFFNFDKLCLGVNGLLSLDFVNLDIYDHHYNKNRYAKLIRTELDLVLQNIPSKNREIG